MFIIIFKTQNHIWGYFDNSSLFLLFYSFYVFTSLLASKFQIQIIRSISINKLFGDKLENILISLLKNTNLWQCEKDIYVQRMVQSQIQEASAISEIIELLIVNMWKFYKFIIREIPDQILPKNILNISIFQNSILSEVANNGGNWRKSEEDEHSFFHAKKLISYHDIFERFLINFPLFVHNKFNLLIKNYYEKIELANILDKFIEKY